MAKRERVYLSVPVTPRKRQEVRAAVLDQNTSMDKWLAAAIDERLERQRHRVSAPPDQALSVHAERKEIGGRPKKLSPKQELRVVERYQSGESPKDIAAEYGIGRSTVTAIARRHGVRVQRSRKKMIEERPISLDTAEEMGKLFAVGKSVNAIADMYKLDPTRVKEIIRTLGLGSSRKSKAPKRLRRSKVTTQQIKDWAAENGLPHLPRGRVPDWVVAQYQQRALDSETVSDIYRRSAAGESPQKIALDYKLTPERVALIVLAKEQPE